MIHLLCGFLIVANIGLMFVPMELYNFWNPMAVGFIGGLWFAVIKG